MVGNYLKLFTPLHRRHDDTFVDAVGDRAEAGRYVFSDKIVLAVNVALAAGRPLLVRGRSGIGKTSLARSVAHDLGWAYFEMVVTSRTEARDFMWRTDHLKRLRDAQLGRDDVQDHSLYITPGPLFWGFDPDAAHALLVRTDRTSLVPPGYIQGSKNTVVLIDEIDKAEPDVPNSLLGPLGALSFDVEDLGVRVTAKSAPFLMITTNEERDLPQAFLRRCVELQIDPPGVDELAAIAGAHFPAADPVFARAVAELVTEQSNRSVSAAEYLDTLRACIVLDVKPSDETFRQIAEATVWKGTRIEAV